MRSRSTLEWAGIALGAVTQAVWCGVLGSALSAASWPPLAGFAAAVMVASAAAARWGAGGGRRLRAARVALAAVVLLAAAALFAAGRGWEHPYLGWQVVRDVFFCAGVALLGVWLGRGDAGPDEAFRRAAWAFGALCAVLALCAMTAAPVQAPAAAVAVVIVAGGLHVAVVRYRRLTDLVSGDDRLPAWPWLLAVAATIVAVLAVTGVAAALLGDVTLRSAFSEVAAVLAFVAGGLAWVVGLVLRAFAWLGGLVHISLPQHELPKIPTSVNTVLPTQKPTAAGSQTLRLVVTVAAAGLAVAAATGVVVLALRRLSRELPRDEAVLEERESVRSVSSVTGHALGGLSRRLWSALRGGRKAQTPAEMIRLSYERLEERLSRAGSPRALGTTVRAYLSASLAAGNSSAADEQVTAGDSGAAELATLYELARYSAHAVDDAQAARFGELARACTPAGAADRRSRIDVEGGAAAPDTTGP